jgi:hypothetical protein
MKRIAIFLAALLAASHLPAATRPKIMIQATVDNGLGFKMPDGVAAALENNVESLMRKQFPCADYITPHDLRNLVGFLRMRGLVGVPADQQAEYEQQLQALGGAVGADYLVVLKAIPGGPGRWMLDGKWLDVRKREALAMELEEFPANGDALVDASERITDKLVDAAAYYEICPYTGPVKIKIHSTRSKHNRVEHLVSCNNQDQQYVKTTTFDRTEDTNLDLQRTGRIWATGEVQYDSREIQELEEQDPCHLCPSGKRGPRIYTERLRTDIKIAGFSQESSTKDHQFTDLRLYLKFDKNGTYTLELVGASKPGTKRVRIERKAEGVCDTEFDKKPGDGNDITTAFDVPLGAITEKFQGTPRDKELVGHKEIHRKNPATEEETTIEVDFQLHRD